MCAQPCDRCIGLDPVLGRKAPDGLAYGPPGQTFLYHLLGSEHILLVPLFCNSLRGRYYLHFQVGTLRHRGVKGHAPGSYSLGHGRTRIGTLHPGFKAAGQPGGRWYLAQTPALWSWMGPATLLKIGVRAWGVRHLFVGCLFLLPQGSFMFLHLLHDALRWAQDICELAWQPPPCVVVEVGKATTNYKVSL